MPGFYTLDVTRVDLGGRREVLLGHAALKAQQAQLAGENQLYFYECRLHAARLPKG